MRLIKLTLLFMAGLVFVAVGPAPGQPLSSPSNPLDLRVTMDFRNRSASDVFQTLARAAGLTLDVGAGDLLPVTISMTNARLETALSAVCENASCRWTLTGRALSVFPEPWDVGQVLPQALSIALSEASVRDVFQALAAALSVQLVVEGAFSDAPVSISFRNASPGDVLNFLAQAVGCSWQLEPGRLVIRRLT